MLKINSKYSSKNNNLMILLKPVDLSITVNCLLMPLRGSRTFFNMVIKSRTRSGDWKLCTNRFRMGHTIDACMEMICEGKKQLTLKSRKRPGPMAQISRRNPSTVIILFLIDSLIFKKETGRGPRTQPEMDNWSGTS